MTSTPASFSSMLSSGVNNFRSALDYFKPRISSCLMLVVPFNVVISGVMVLLLGGFALAGAGLASNASTEEEAVGAVLGSVAIGLVLSVLLLTPVSAYYGFCFSRFVCKASRNTTDSFSFRSLWGYDSTFWGYLGLLFLQMLAAGLAMAGVMVLSMVLFFLLGLPMILAYPVLVCFLASSSLSYFDAPESGPIAALSRGWALMSKDWRRWAAMSLLLLGVGLVTLLVNLLLSFTIGLIPFVGALAVMIAAFLISCYALLAIALCYRESCASVS